MAHEVSDPPRSAGESGAEPRAPSPGPELPGQEADQGVRRLHSAAMIADVLGVPPAAIRHWIRTGLLAVAHRSGSLEWLDFGQLVAGRQLASLLRSGFSLREIDAGLATLPRGSESGMIDRVVVDGRRLSVVRDGRLLGPGGQLQLPFEAAGPGLLEKAGDGPAVVGLPAAVPRSPADPDGGDLVADILDLADDLEAAGEFAEAAEALRAVLQTQGPTAEVNFMLAELLYRAGDLTAARERYYAALELDGEHLRARANLGCVLAELGEGELALAALEGVLRQEPDYAEAHWHVAGVLAALGREADARRHLRRFLELAADSPWAAVARDRLR